MHINLNGNENLKEMYLCFQKIILPVIFPKKKRLQEYFSEFLFNSFRIWVKLSLTAFCH